LPGNRRIGAERAAREIHARPHRQKIYGDCQVWEGVQGFQFVRVDVNAGYTHATTNEKAAREAAARMAKAIGRRKRERLVYGP
jgi:hypothetical protein